MSLERYRQIIPDWEGFQHALRTREPATFRVRTGLISADELLPQLVEQGFHAVPVEGVPSHYRVEGGPRSIAQTVEHWLGLLHVQQSVMGLPSLALAPRPGERILDLCAAPGGKTAHLSELMEDRGPLVAVDPKEKRLRGLLANVYRLGHPNVLVIAADGRRIPLTARFDRVLVDAPCSAEGNVRKQRGRLPKRGGEFVAHVTSLQEALLRRAIAVTRPGGVIVYSTCTFAPEENEAIVDRVLRDSPIRLEAIPLDAPHAPGLEAWEGERFHPDLVKAWRVYPHHLDSGGLFMARLRRLPDGDTAADADGWDTISAAFPGQDESRARVRIDEAKEALESRFGIAGDSLDELGWMVRTDNVWAHTAERWPIPAWQSAPLEEGSRWRVVSLGLRALRNATDGREIPSNQFLCRWGVQLDPERRLELPDRQLISILEGDEPLPGPFPVGPVALVRRGRILGRGMVGRRGLVSEIPRATASRLMAVLQEGTEPGDAAGVGTPGDDPPFMGEGHPPSR